MSKKSYSFYPGCSSQKAASASNYMVSVDSMCETLDIELNEIPDWNCCSASIGYAGGGELPRLALSARNMAISEQANPGPGHRRHLCRLLARHQGDPGAPARRQQADGGNQRGAGRWPVSTSKADQKMRHMVEVLIEDFGYDELGKHVKKPLDGIKIAGYVGCQTNRPFGIDGESYENPKYLDKLVETMGAEPIENYDKKVSCCGGALAFSEPEKSQALIKDIIESAYDGGADMIVTPCPVCQMNVEVYQNHINQKYKTNFKMPVVYYSTLMSVAYGKQRQGSRSRRPDHQGQAAGRDRLQIATCRGQIFKSVPVRNHGPSHEGPFFACRDAGTAALVHPCTSRHLDFLSIVAGRQGCRERRARSSRPRPLLQRTIPGA